MSLSLNLTRRHFLSQTATGMAAFAQLQGLPSFPAKAKRVIYLFQSGGPSQLESFDYKPALRQHHGEELPTSIRRDQCAMARRTGTGR